MGGNADEWKLETRTRKIYMAVGEACVAIF